MKRLALVSMSLVAFSAAPAVASTLPPLGIPGNKTVVSVGLFDLNVDTGLTDRFSIGASVAGADVLFAAGGGGAIRGTFLLFSSGDRSQLQGGLTLSAGGDTTGSIAGTTSELWVQPALNLSYAPTDWLAVRMTLGPLLGPRWDNRNAMALQSPWVPNLEVAFRDPAHGREYTLGGNSLLGVRWMF